MSIYKRLADIQQWIKIADDDDNVKVATPIIISFIYYSVNTVEKHVL